MTLPKEKSTIILIVVVILVLILGGLFFKTVILPKSSTAPTQEVMLNFDPEGPYALLFPRRDGNALVLNIKRTASYQEISYDLTYSDQDGIDRGVSGNIDTKQSKGEYEQEILFGTCSKNICKYDKGVENGTLNLRIKKDNVIYKMIVEWHLQQPDLALGKLISGDSHFSYKIDPKSPELVLVKYTIISDLTGAPKLPEGKEVLGKVYAVNPPAAKNLTLGEVTIELASKPSSDAKIFTYQESENKWLELETKIVASSLTAKAPSGGIFAVLTSKK